MDVHDEKTRERSRLHDMNTIHEIVRRVEPLLLVAVAIKDIDKPQVKESTTPKNEIINKQKKP